jgi:enoyl-CoA hydratase/carnithine racemase
MSELLIARRDAVAVLTLNRPEHGNRLTTALARAVAAALDSARADGATRAAVLTGAGEAFCLGGDWRGAGPTTAGREDYADALLALDRAMRGLDKPLVAAVNGDAHAGGFATVAACDLAVCADDATLGLPEAANGLFPLIALAIVRDALPKKLLFELSYTSRLLSAGEALAERLVNECRPREQVLERAVELAAHAGSRQAEVTALGRGLYYRTAGLGSDAALEEARHALLAALAAADGA